MHNFKVNIRLWSKLCQQSLIWTNSKVLLNWWVEHVKWGTNEVSEGIKVMISTTEGEEQAHVFVINRKSSSFCKYFEVASCFIEPFTVREALQSGKIISDLDSKISRVNLIRHKTLPESIFVHDRARLSDFAQLADLFTLHISLPSRSSKVYLEPWASSPRRFLDNLIPSPTIVSFTFIEHYRIWPGDGNGLSGERMHLWPFNGFNFAWPSSATLYRTSQNRGLRNMKDSPQCPQTLIFLRFHHLRNISVSDSVTSPNLPDDRTQRWLYSA